MTTRKGGKENPAAWGYKGFVRKKGGEPWPSTGKKKATKGETRNENGQGGPG